ncbi:ABC transporter permease [Mesorhizobium sp.]|uniref:ABC transporter permease n=1 Tax=Mesorhizobium sp. TaxID=1871066 RepID=UPI000FE5D446|nr:ABC transporter permease [Mesorhizobium sp.]RWB69987.1 MAG: ABC transporter permease [Mesorhizobium sp.]
MSGTRDKVGLVSPVWLILPAAFFTLILFGVSAVLLLRMSFNRHPPDGIYEQAWTIESYISIMTIRTNLITIADTLSISFVTAIVTVVIAFIFAFYIWSLSPKNRILLVAVALCPMLISEISVIIGWRLFFPFNGFLSYSLLSIGLTPTKINLLGTNFAALVGLSYLSVSYCFFTILSVLNGIDRNLLLASGDLGASPARTFLNVLLPLSAGGIASAFTQAFVFTMGTYATLNALGPDSLWSIGYEIQKRMLTQRDWPFASAFAIVLVTLIATVSMLVQYSRRRWGPKHV